MYSRFSMWLAVSAFFAVMGRPTLSPAQDCDVYLTVSETPALPVSIPDFNYLTPVTRSLLVEEHFTICEVIVDVDIAPGYEGQVIRNGDVALNLRHEGTGEHIRLIDQIGTTSPFPPQFGGPGNGIHVTLRDDAPDSIHDAEVWPTDPLGQPWEHLAYHPWSHDGDYHLSDFIGIDAYGSWTLELFDLLLDSPLAHLHGWSLTFKMADGYADGADNCPDIYNPDQANGDGDGMGDACDACPGIPDAREDCDSDGIPDCLVLGVCQQVYSQLYDLMPDKDLDGVVALHKVSVPTDGRVCDLSVEIQTEGGDFNEPTIILKKYDQVEIYDVIAEGQLSTQGGSEWKPLDPSVFAGLPSGGYWALSVSDIDPEVLADTDGNDIPDICDNCPLTYNPAQTDSDTDGMGDACDPVCTLDEHCDDQDYCTLDLCIEGACDHSNVRPKGDVDKNGVINVFDIFCLLDAISGDSPCDTCP